MGVAWEQSHPARSQAPGYHLPDAHHLAAALQRTGPSIRSIREYALISTKFEAYSRMLPDYLHSYFPILGLKAELYLYNKTLASESKALWKSKHESAWDQ